MAKKEEVSLKLVLGIIIVVAAVAVAFVLLGNRIPSFPGKSTSDFNTLVNDLVATGAKVDIVGSVSQPFFSVEGKAIRVNDDDVQVFEYKDSAAAEKDASLVSPDGYTIGTTVVDWVATPHFYKKDRLIVLYVGERRGTTQFLERVFEAQFAPVAAGEEEIGFTVLEEFDEAAGERRDYQATDGPLSIDVTQITTDENILVRVSQTFNTGGYNLEVVRVVEAGANIEIFVKQTSPGPGCLVTQVISTESHAVAVPNLGKPLKFNLYEEVRSC